MAQQLRGKEKLPSFREPYDGMSLAGKRTEYCSQIPELTGEELHET